MIVHMHTSIGDHIEALQLTVICVARTFMHTGEAFGTIVHVSTVL
jgi:hypothetical protein